MRNSSIAVPTGSPIAVPTGWVFVALLALLSFSNCRCADQRSYDDWEFERRDTTSDDRFDAISTFPPEDVGPVDTGSLDVADGREDTNKWQPEEVLPEIECRDALNDRTSLIVDSDGTLWLGYHHFRGENCRNPTLVVAHKRVGGEWVEEDLQPHNDIFGLSTINPGRPIAVYPDTDAGTFKASHRMGDQDWRTHVFDIGDREVQTGDGFDVTQDGTSFWVTFAGDGASEVNLFEYDLSSASRSRWTERAPLEVEDPRAAMARGLRAGSSDSVYLVHRSARRDRFGLARYDKNSDMWPERGYFGDRDADARVHSFAISSEFGLCMSSRIFTRLLVTCGDLSNLERSRMMFDTQSIPQSYPSSIIEGRNGTLYVAFHPSDNSELRVAKLPPGGNWSIRTVFDGPAYGVSTAIDTSGKLVLGFYTCDETDRCSLKVLREEPADL